MTLGRHSISASPVSVRRVLAVMAASLSVMLATSLPAFASSSEEEPHRFEAEIVRGAELGDLQSAEDLSAWRQLTPEEGEVVARIGADPRTAPPISSTSSGSEILRSINPNATVVRDEGKRVLRQKVSAAASLRSTTRVLYEVHAWQTEHWKIGRATISRIRQDFYYQTDAVNVTRVYDCQASSRNYSPTRNVSAVRTSSWSSAGKGYCNITWRIDTALIYVPIPLGHREFIQHMVVNGRNVEKAYYSYP